MPFFCRNEAITVKDVYAIILAAETGLWAHTVIIKTDKFCKQVIFQGIQTVPAVNEAETVLLCLIVSAKEEAAKNVQST